MNLKADFKLLAYIMLFIDAILLIPTGMAAYYGETESLNAFIQTEVMILIFCLLIILFTRKVKILDISTKDSYIFVTLTWVIATAFGCLPLYFTGTTTSYAESFFEIMSGFTTTGATAIPVVEDHPMSILFWRNLTNWLGGMGIVVLFVAVLPVFGVKGTALVGAESVGPTKDKLTPQIRGTAMSLWLIYLGISAVQVLLLYLGGLDLFDSLTVMFGTMGAAGFTPTNQSIETFHSAYVEWICIIFMFIAGGNFALYFKLLQKKLGRVFRDGEYRLYFMIVFISGMLAAMNLFANGVFGLHDSIRHAFFQIVSIITTTGFYSTNYNLWPMFPQMLMFLMMFIGGCAGSTGGGIKVIRVRVLFKMGTNAMIKRNHPYAITNVRIGDDTYNTDTCLSIAGFVCFYMITALIGTVVISLSNMDFVTCLTSVMQAIGNIGIAIGGMGVTTSFHDFAPPFQWVLSILMLVGRLELFTVFSLFTKKFWTK